MAARSPRKPRPVARKTAAGTPVKTPPLEASARPVQAPSYVPGRLVGSPIPRLYTPELRPLTPETSRGFDLCRFADEVLGLPFLPWQRELAIRALEVDASGKYRFRTVLVIAARQNGKSHFMKALVLWKMLCDDSQLVLGSAQNLSIAREVWESACDMARSAPAIAPFVAAVRMGNTDPHLLLKEGQRYKIATTTRDAARGLTVDTLLLDELRTHESWDAWQAMTPTTSARPKGQTWCLSNAGDQKSVVLNSLRANALAGRDPSLFIAEWSAVDGCELDDPQGWCQANPALGHTLSESALRSAMMTDPPALFRTEHLSQYVQVITSAVDIAAWRASSDPSANLAGYVGKLVCGLDVSLDGAHTTLVAAAKMPDGRIRVETVGGWWSTAKAREELPALLAALKPVRFAWFPGGPSAALGTFLASQTGSTEVKGAEVTRACMEFSELVSSGLVVHDGSELLSAQVAGAGRTITVSGYSFTRGNAGHVDGVYAAAGACHAVLTLPVEVPRRKAMYR